MSPPVLSIIRAAMSLMEPCPYLWGQVLAPLREDVHVISNPIGVRNL